MSEPIVKAKIDVQLKPFTVPSFVRAVSANDKDDSGCWPISSLSPETLEELCEEFTREVFERAGKRRPTRVSCA